MKFVLWIFFTIYGIIFSDINVDESVLFELGQGCGSKDIRYDSKHLKLLENCKVIFGYLRISDMNFESEDFEKFPELIQVSDYVLIDNVKNLTSLSNLFPNLTTIEGEVTYRGSSLVITANQNLTSVGLKSLTQIRNGNVKIENNPELCFVETVDWAAIIKKNSLGKVFILVSNFELLYI